MPKTAFLVLRSPQELDPTDMMNRFADEKDACVILLEDGVYHALLSAPAEKLGKAANEILASREDVEARGYMPEDLRVGKAAEYSDIIDCIMERTERTITV